MFSNERACKGLRKHASLPLAILSARRAGCHNMFELRPVLAAQKSRGKTQGSLVRSCQRNGSPNRIGVGHARSDRRGGFCRQSMDMHVNTPCRCSWPHGRSNDWYAMSATCTSASGPKVLLKAKWKKSKQALKPYPGPSHRL